MAYNVLHELFLYRDYYNLANRGVSSTAFSLLTLHQPHEFL